MPKHETFGQFFERRIAEMQRSGENGEIGKMYLTDVLKMIENEYYDCDEDDPLPQSATPATFLMH